jgi:hypothetical protein
VSYPAPHWEASTGGGPNFEIESADSLCRPNQSIITSHQTDINSCRATGKSRLISFQHIIFEFFGLLLKRCLQFRSLHSYFSSSRSNKRKNCVLYVKSPLSGIPAACQFPYTALLAATCSSFSSAPHIYSASLLAFSADLSFFPSFFLCFLPSIHRSNWVKIRLKKRDPLPFCTKPYTVKNHEKP